MNPENSVAKEPATQKQGHAMQKVLLIHAGKIPHYRCPIYRYLAEYLARSDYQLTVLSNGIEPGAPDVDLPLIVQKLDCISILKCVRRLRPESVILFSGFRSLWLFPVITALKMAGVKVIYWGHGINLQKKESLRTMYSLLHAVSDVIILYAPHLKAFVKSKHHHKIFIANNTLNTYALPHINGTPKAQILGRYGIRTEQNVICVGRMQRRKRIMDLVEAFLGIENEKVGLILVGPDSDGMLQAIDHPRIYRLGPLYGREAAELQSASSICCIPGTVGLGIVDAFFYGLPLITEDVDHSPEIMYLKDGVNGFMVPRGDTVQLRGRIRQLLEDRDQLASFSASARATIVNEGHIDGFCNGFLRALNHVCRGAEHAGVVRQPLPRHVESPKVPQLSDVPSQSVADVLSSRVPHRREVDVFQE